MKQMSLLDEPLPPGFQLFPSFITQGEEQELLRNIKGLAWQPVQMKGVIAKRKVVHYGLNYIYDSWQLEKTDPTPEFLLPLQARAAAKMGVASDQIAEVLVSYYPLGAGIGWHRDAPMFGDKILGVSLGGDCVMKLRAKRGEKFETQKIALEPRSAYILSGPARNEWQHSIPAVKGDRWSVTFRTLKR